MAQRFPFSLAMLAEAPSLEYATEAAAFPVGAWLPCGSLPLGLLYINVLY
ncbi:hypothetical protein [Thermogemmatispora sp.]|nr:hypothetical protein [Thermogemmatispora sp.]